MDSWQEASTGDDAHVVVLVFIRFLCLWWDFQLVRNGHQFQILSHLPRSISASFAGETLLELLPGLCVALLGLTFAGAGPLLEPGTFAGALAGSYWKPCDSYWKPWNLCWKQQGLLTLWVLPGSLVESYWDSCWSLVTSYGV
jgi:hypothetical protein